MDDTPDNVKKIHRRIWFAKLPEERLRLTLQHNKELFKFCNEMKGIMAKTNEEKLRGKKLL